MTCLKWLSGSSNLFLAAHSSGHLYLYNEELPCAPTAPHYQPLKLGDGYSVQSCKSKVARNPLQRWTFGTTTTSTTTTTSDHGSINEFAFSPCGLNLAIASQDGFLRVFRYESMELLGIARSYFGGFLCVCWSPDGRYIVVGGEDDLVTVWSLHERRVVARGQGHRSWVSVVAFDPYTTSYAGVCPGEDNNDVSDDDGVSMLYRNTARSSDQLNNNNNNNSNRQVGGDDFYYNNNSKLPNGVGGNSNSTRGRRRESSMRHSVSGSTSYRLGSVSQDTQLCLWDITEDVLRPGGGVVGMMKPVQMRYSGGTTGTSAATQEQGKGAGMRIEVKPSSSGAGGAVMDGSVAGSSSNNNGQTPVSSLSSISSSNNNNNNIDKVDGCTDAVIVHKGGTGGAAGVASNNSHNVNNSSSGSKQKPTTTTISLIGNCVGNNTHKMTMSSSISSTSSMASNAAGGPVDEVAVTTTTTNKAIGNGAKHSSDSSTNSSSGIMTLNAFTQRLSHFSFGNDKGSSSSSKHGEQQSHGKKGFTLSKTFGGGSNSVSSK